MSLIVILNHLKIAKRKVGYASKAIEKEYNHIDVGVAEINLDDELLGSPNKPSQHK